MIISQDIHPQRDLYYLGAMVLEYLGQSKEDQLFDYLEIYGALNKDLSMSLNTYSLTLDWLFLLEAIEYNDGGIRKCF